MDQPTHTLGGEENLAGTNAATNTQVARLSVANENNNTSPEMGERATTDGREVMADTDGWDDLEALDRTTNADPTFGDDHTSSAFPTINLSLLSPVGVTLVTDLASILAEVGGLSNVAADEMTVALRAVRGLFTDGARPESRLSEITDAAVTDVFNRGGANIEALTAMSVREVLMNAAAQVAHDINSGKQLIKAVVAAIEATLQVIDRSLAGKTETRGQGGDVNMTEAGEAAAVPTNSNANNPGQIRAGPPQTAAAPAAPTTGRGRGNFTNHKTVKWSTTEDHVFAEMMEDPQFKGMSWAEKTAWFQATNLTAEQHERQREALRLHAKILVGRGETVASLRAKMLAANPMTLEMDVGAKALLDSVEAGYDSQAEEAEDEMAEVEEGAAGAEDAEGYESDDLYAATDLGGSDVEMADGEAGKNEVAEEVAQADERN